MRKPRDLDAELKALQAKARDLRAKQRTQLGELVTAIGAEALGPEVLAGVLLEALERARAQPDCKEGWLARGQAFFRRRRRGAALESQGLVGALDGAADRSASDGGAGSAPGAGAGPHGHAELGHGPA